MKITKPGIHEMKAEEYHADPCPTPSLSASIATKLIDQSPRHAWAAHPRLNTQHEKEEAAQFDLGGAAHALILEGRDSVVPIDHDNWRTKAAKEERDLARNAGNYPLLRETYNDALAMVDACYAQLDATEDAKSALRGGNAEQSWFWRDGKTWLRCRPDWYGDEHVIYDYKTTGGSAHPDTWTRRLYDVGGDLRAALYSEAATTLLGWNDIIYRFVIQETKPPYALSIVQLQPSALALAWKRYDKALQLWQQCMETDTWPGYPAQIAHVEAPPWQEQRFAEREARDEFMARMGKDEIQSLINWQAPLVAGQGGSE